ncbi:hypothetical protein [Candidatus Enterococcus mansonii]|uniref:WxL domain-containing protein n=1 Tax=Candidatus Enterococcus mansonii TaxID=1834181 RepID=A0A242CGU7_9ENTE|nr:hypothetical protein [Enterococcus sp. 4G2_DIV0659]OTO09389.1 hypothetical protein A5880_000068 [Enterococcus sp. 4G2_DIV0659]
MKLIKKKLFFSIVLILFSFVIEINTSIAESASSSPRFELGWIDKHPKWSNIRKTTIPKEHNFFMKHTNDTKAIDLTGGAKISGEYIDFSKITSTGSVRLTNVGFYGGKSIDVKVSVTSESSKEFLIGFKKNTFLNIIFDTPKNRVAHVKYEYFITNTNTPIAIGQYTNYTNIDVNVSIFIPNSSLSKILSVTPTYTTYDKSITNGLYATGSQESSSRDDPAYGFVALLKPTTSVTIDLTKPSNYQRHVGVYYNGAADTDIETSDLDGIDTKLDAVEDKNSIAEAEYMQLVPYKYNANYYYKNFSLTIPLENNHMMYDSLEIRDREGNDVSKKFDIKKTGTELSVSALGEELKKSSFYDNAYMFKLKYKIDFSKEIAPSKLDASGYYHLRTSAKRNLNGVITSAESNVSVNFNSQLTAKHTLDGKLIPGTSNFVVNKFLTQKTKIPTKLKGYQLVSYIPNTGDLDNYLMEKTTSEVTLNYRRLDIPILSIADTALTVNLSDSLLHLKGNVKLDGLEFYGYSIFLEYNKNKQEIVSAETNSEGKDFDVTVKLTDINAGKLDAKVYALDEFGRKSTVVNLSIDVVGSLKFNSLPVDSEFGVIKIPSKKEWLKPKQMQAFQVGDYRGANKHFQLKVMFVDRSQNNQLSDRLFFKKDADSEMERLVNNQAIPVYKGSTQAEIDKNEFNINFENDTGLFFEATPDMKIGSFQGDLVWTLEDVPHESD